MAKTRIIMTEKVVPVFPKGVRLKFDKKRKQWVVLAPERMFVLDEIGISVMHCVDGKSNVDEIVDSLSKQFKAPREEILDDVVEMLQDMADKGVLDE
ncbi:MAG: Coenzyme PQQ synthesis protein D [Alphaproteobacteria bacterium MarineAlpha3_Bin5]|nr:pyrroloquinoline quinone biosynthesis peptide chaperone PqqD [Magnetovibrio sp.]PPR76071.1 MAG: Coenzyme PQQ synthesis protein D [Alphaproteobacteria bacterium MarineAlpha3_Bin5]|tara:strand:+ start:494 stop:784 length:291 start_codon:yes stop_codon:yes gene_type:complete